MVRGKRLWDFDLKGRFKKEGAKPTDWLLRFPIIEEVLNSLKTEKTRKSYATAFNLFFRHIDMYPDAFIELSDHEIYNLVTDYFRYLEREDKASLGHSLKFAIKKLLRRLGRDFDIRTEDDIEYYRKRATTDNKYIPTKEEIYKMIDYTNNPRDKALLICLFQSGLRVGSLTQLTYGMVKDYLYDTQGNPIELIDKDGVRSEKLPIPLRISKRKDNAYTILDGKVSKQVLTYYTYLGLESALLIQDLIEWRKKNEGWIPEDHHVIFNSQGYKVHGNKKPMSHFWTKKMSSPTVSAVIGTIAKRIGIDPDRIWAHLFRTAFQNFVDYETGIPTFSQHLMGHQLKEATVAARYGEYGDTPRKRELYMRIGWGRGTVHRVWQLEQEAKARNNRIKELEEKLSRLEARENKIIAMAEYFERKIKEEKIK